ncbi:hybrid sensor histidine kinase/response regulator [Pedobacter frigoris]|uniref:histidine kinase n=1 Tax=Pedobacter frigoris TaxID=2571272 RepID=A0A4U1CDG7_9SPHI|nr:hybrid sensor histidine kinase/response regulator [Pedobacter frigoris]TKC05008.1 response regulator [Pedobacter frigoris]
MKQVRVLLIDDDEDDYILTKGIFNHISERYTLAWVDNYDKGISAINKKQFDVYLVDYRLGKGTGIDLLEEAINSGCEQPIIMLTGKGDITIDEQAMNIGAADYLVKDEIEPPLLDRSIRYSIKQAGILKALKDSERKYRAIFEQANDPILVSDCLGTIHDINSSGLKFFGYERSEFINLKDAAIFNNAMERERFKEMLEANGSLSDFECELVSEDGTVYYCSLSSFIQMDLVNVSEVYHTIIRDLSYRRHIEEKSVSLGKMYISEHIAKGLGEEIRDPLSTINLALDELSAESAIANNESVQAYLEIIKGNCDRVTQLIQNFISSTETKNLNLQRHQMKEVIEESVADLEDLILGHNIELTTTLLHLDKKVLLDKPKIKEALKSIIKNAVEAMQSYPKKIHITCRVNDDMYEIGVEDNGIGVDPPNQHKIFEPFFTTKKRANGLGLTHAQRVLTTHNGSLELKSIPEGSLFLIHIPIYHEGALWF